MSNIINPIPEPCIDQMPVADSRAPAEHGRFAVLSLDELQPDPLNPRKHSREQIRAIARSIKAFGFNAPILIDRNKRIVAGHGRYEAAKLGGRTESLSSGASISPRPRPKPIW
jgi:ParB-like nuclease domain